MADQVTQHRVYGMELKDRIEQRRKEREAEAIVVAKQNEAARVQAVKEAAARQQRLTSQALNLLSSSEETSPEATDRLTTEEAEEFLEKAAMAAVSGWGAAVWVAGACLGGYVGFRESWALGIMIASGAIVIGATLTIFLAKEKKQKMMQDHLLKKATLNLVPTDEVADSNTKLKDLRRILTRYDRPAVTFLSAIAIAIAAIVIFWI